VLQLIIKLIKVDYM